MAWLNRIYNTLRPGGLGREVEDEVRLHLDLRARELERSGWSGEAAREQAARQFGNVTLEKERMRDMDIAGWFETIGKDVRYALRQLARNPGFTAVAVLSLALGIGANTAIFSVLNAALLRTLPVRNPGELVTMTDPTSTGSWIGSQTGQPRDFLTYPEFVALRDRSTMLSGVCAASAQTTPWQARIAGGSQEEVRGSLVSENYFSVFGIGAAMGRVFTAADAGGVGQEPYTVISYDYWQRRFGGSAAVLGTALRLAHAEVTVIGVAARGFHGENVAQGADLWVPIAMQPLVMPGRDWLHDNAAQPESKNMWLHVFGRRKPGVSVAQAQAEESALFRQIIAASYPATMRPETRKELMDQRIVVQDASTGVFDGRDTFARQLIILLAISALVLLIACANIANLLLARATARHREVGIRLSMGAGKGRLMRQFLTESLALSFLGGACGLAVAFAGSKALLMLLSQPDAPPQLGAAFDVRVLGFSIAITLLTAVLFGLAPAIRGTRVDINETLKETGRGVTAAGGRLTLAKGLVAAQVGLCLVLIVGAGLFLRTLWNLQSVSLGYPKERLLLLRVYGVTAGYEGNRLAALYHEIAARLGRLPGVQGVAFSENGLFGGTESGDPVDVEGFTPPPKGDRSARYDEVGPGYFSTLGIPLLLGREIGAHDTANSMRVCVINEAFAKTYFASRNPIGKRVTDLWGDKRIDMRVAGVARDARDHSLRDKVPPRFYAAVDHGIEGVPPSVYFELRTAGDAEQLLKAARKTVADINEDLPVVQARTLERALEQANAHARLIARLCAIFGAIALLLAATGLYGVLSYGVARRTNEIGIRMALGAGRGRVIGMILRETGVMIAIGMAAGIAAAAASTRLVAAQLYGLTAMDPETVAGAAALLAFVALLAAYIPAARAAGVNPVAALRHE